MGLFTGIGNFFRGIFGENDEEKRRREQREAAERAARAQQNQNTSQNTLRVGVAQPQGNVVVEKPKPVQPIKVQPLFQNKPAPKVKVEAPRVQPKIIVPKPTPKELQRQRAQIAMAEAEAAKKKGFNPIKALFQTLHEDIYQPTMRSLPRLANELRPGQDSYTPGSRVEKFFFGDKEVKGFTQAGEELGIKNKPAAFVAGAGITGLDFLGGKGRAGKNLVKTIADEIEPSKIASVLRNTTDIADDLVDDVARKLAGTNDEREVTNIIEEASTATKVAQQEVDKAPAYQRKEDQARLDAAKEQAAKDAVPDAAIDTKAAFQHKKDIEAIVKRENDNLKRHLLENPQYTRQQVEAAQQAAQQRTLKLVDDLQRSRQAGVEAVEGQGKTIDANAAKQAETNAEVAANAAAKTTPAPDDIVQGAPTTPNPEVAANDAYNPDVNIDTVSQRIDATTDRIKETQGETNNPLLKLFNFGRRQTTDKYREGVDKARDKVADIIYEGGVASSNRANAALGNAPRLMFDKFGLKDTDKLKVNRFAANKTANKARVQAQARDIEDMFAKTPDPGETAKRMYQLFEEPDMLARMYGDGTPKIRLEDLTPQERAIADRLIELNKVRNDVWYRILQERHIAGEITDDALMQARQSWIKNQSGLHSPRIYNQDLEHLGIKIKGQSNPNAGAYKQRKDVAELSQKTIDSINANPAQSMLFRLQTGMDELARIDTMKQLEQAGLVREAPANNRWVKLEGGQYGAANGKYVDPQIAGELELRQIFKTDAGQRTSDLLDVYRNSIFGTLDRAIKRTKTSYSPGTFLGNLFSNPLFFNRGSGVNALSQAFNMTRNVKTLAQHLNGKILDQDILDMQRLGVKIGNTSDDLVGLPKDYRVIAENGTMQSIKDIALLPNQIYAGADDLAKVSIYKTLISRGMPKEKAALRAAQFTQDYANAGRAVQMLADSPVLGQPFARFVPELIRLTKNNVLYNPVGTFAGLYGIAKLQQKLTEDSDETPEQRRLRENEPGKVKLPFTGWVNELAGGEGDISLDFPIGDSAVNAARALGFNFPIEPGSDATTSLLKNLAPFAIPFMKDESGGDVEFQPQQIVSSMLLKPLAEQVANEDFMGRKLDDPLNRTRWELPGKDETKYSDELPGDKKRNNRLYGLLMNYAPLSSEVDAGLTKTGIRDELTGAGELDKGKDFYGKERTTGQTIARLFGVKIQKNDQEAREKRVETDRYFKEDLPATEKFLGENPELAQDYWKIKSTSKDRNSLIKANDTITPEKWQIIQSDKSGRLLDFLGEQEKRLNARSIEEHSIDPTKPIKPIDPLYSLNDEQKKVVINIMSRPTGDDKEAEAILRATQPWFEAFEKARRDYYDLNEKYYDAQDLTGDAKPNPRVEAYFNTPYPDQPPLVKQYYQIMNSQGKDAAKAWGKTQGDALSAQFDADNAARLIYTNAKREIEGYPPISEEVWNNDTFGFKEDDGSGGYGYGGGGGGGRTPEGYGNTLGDITNFTGSVNRLDPIEAAAMPELAQLFARLQAGRGGGKKKPTLGASASGR